MADCVLLKSGLINGLPVKLGSPQYHIQWCILVIGVGFSLQSGRFSNAAPPSRCKILFVSVRTLQLPITTMYWNYLFLTLTVLLPFETNTYTDTPHLTTYPFNSRPGFRPALSPVGIVRCTKTLIVETTARHLSAKHLISYHPSSVCLSPVVAQYSLHLRSQPLITCIHSK